MQTIPFSDVRAHLAETLKQLETSDEPVFISRRGAPAAVLMSVAHYRQLSGQGGGPAERLAAWRARFLRPEGSEPLASAADQGDPWADVRDRRPARPVDWSDEPSQGSDAP